MALPTSLNEVLRDKTVVEYFNRNVGGYLVAGRTNEQALPGAQPA